MDECPFCKSTTAFLKEGKKVFQCGTIEPFLKKNGKYKRDTQTQDCFGFEMDNAEKRIEVLERRVEDLVNRPFSGRGIQ